MKTLLIAGVFALAAVAVFPAAASAQLYQYVACSGNVKVIDAANSSAALAASDIATHSGVILVSSGGLQISSSMTVSGVSCQ